MTNESHSIQFHSEQRLQNKITPYLYDCRLMKLHGYGIQQQFRKSTGIKNATSIQYANKFVAQRLP